MTHREWQARAEQMGLGDAVARRDWERVAEIWATASHELNGAARRRLEVAFQNARTLRFAAAAQREDPELSEALDLEYHAFGPWAGEDPEREGIEHAVGEAMDAEDWQRVARLYESAPYDLDYLELARLDIARTRLGEPGAGARPAAPPRALSQRWPWQAPESEPAHRPAEPEHVALGHGDREVAVAGLAAAALGEGRREAATTIQSDGEVAEALASWIPDVLRRARPGREGRRAYDFEVDSVVGRGPLRLEAAGTCTLMFESAPAPFALDLRLGASHAIAELHLRIGGGTGDDLAVEFVAPGDGEFSAPERNLIVSREGFSVRSRPPYSVFYLEGGRELKLFVEMLMVDEIALATRRSDVSGSSGADGPIELTDAERDRVIRNVQRALAWDGTTLVVI